MFRALIPENTFKGLHHLSNDLFALAGDGVVLALRSTNGGFLRLATRQKHQSQHGQKLITNKLSHK